MKPETHRNITGLAAGLYLGAFKDSLLAKQLKTERLLKALLDGTEDEDKKRPSRGLNWHFYPQNDTIEHDTLNMVFFKLRPTSRWILEKRQKKLLKKLKHGASESLFNYMGRILHHIQDMSTPTHVVPIYHSKNPADPFETYICDHWSQIKKGLNSAAVGFLSDIGMPGDNYFVSLYDAAGETLQKNLEPNLRLFPVTINGDNTRIPSSAFWRSYDEAPCKPKTIFRIDGFGSFGPLGAQYGTCESYNHNGNKILVDKKVYEKIALFFMQSAVEDSLKALKIFEGLHCQSH